MSLVEVRCVDLCVCAAKKWVQCYVVKTELLIAMTLYQYNTRRFCFGNQVQRVNAAAFASDSKSACELRTDIGVGTRNNNALVKSDTCVWRGLPQCVAPDARTSAATRRISFSVFAEKTVKKFVPGETLKRLSCAVNLLSLCKQICL